jgi:hypothetical protein
MSRLKLPLGTWFCIALTVFWVFAIIPGMIRARDLPGELAVANKELKAKVDKASADTRAGMETQQMGRAFGRTLDASGMEHSAQLVRESYRMAVGANARLISVQPLAPTVRGDFMKYSAQVNVESDMKGIKNLLLALRDTEPPLDPERVMLRTNADGKKINAQLTMASFAWAPKGKAKRRA